MRKQLWLVCCVCGPLVLAAGCSRDSTSPTDSAADSALLSDIAVDPTLSAAAGQASLPGLTMEPSTTYSGSVGATNPCSYTAQLGRVVCTPVVRHGLTITRSIAYNTAAGVAQPKRDADTRFATTWITVKGTITARKGTVAVDRASALTVSGLGRGAVTHTLNGSEGGTSTGTFATEKGTVTSAERFEAATTNVVVPADAKHAWPLSGTTSRSSTVTISVGGGPIRTHTSSETVTYNGTSVVSVTVVRDGKTSSCTRDLATHKLTCP
jgi:hypothetical protein